MGDVRHSSHGLDYMKTRSCNYFSLYVLLVILSALITGFGSSQASTNTRKTSGLKKRVLVSNTIGNVILDPITRRLIPGNGAVDIMDASTDRFVSRDNPLSDLFPALHIDSTGAAGMATAGGITAVINATSNS